MTSSIFLVSLIFVGISMLVSFILRSKFSRYNKIIITNGLTGKQLAEKMLRENGIYDVKVVSATGFLSDRYNPLTKTVNLSAEVYAGSSVSAAAVAAHECSHAVQSATYYPCLTLRSKLVAVVNVSSSTLQWVLLAGILMVSIFPGYY